MLRLNKGVFIDRDDTINRDVHYCSRPEDFELLPNVAAGISLLNQEGFKVVVITNQSGIARGYFTEEMLHKIHQKMVDELGDKLVTNIGDSLIAGIPLNEALYFSYRKINERKGSGAIVDGTFVKAEDLKGE